MGIQRRAGEPAGITNASGQPEIVLELNGLTLSMAPPQQPRIDLARFVEAHQSDLNRALAEIEAGHKRTHWMWYVFPQVAGLGTSVMSVKYAISGAGEAVAFLEHPLLGGNYRRLVTAVWTQVVRRGAGIHAIFGSPDDAKLVSSLTLFRGAAQRLDPEGWGGFVGQIDAILAAAARQGLPPCPATVAVLAGAG
jgi:uncharacterized protein (DUF1810 family)